jgi:hypothetical protein
VPCVDLGERLVEGSAASRARSEHLGRVLVRPKQGLTGPLLRPNSIRGQARRLYGCRPLL